MPKSASPPSSKNTGSEPAGFKPMRATQEGEEDEREMRMKAEMIQTELNICFLLHTKDNVKSRQHKKRELMQQSNYFVLNHGMN